MSTYFHIVSVMSGIVLIPHMAEMEGSLWSELSTNRQRYVSVVGHIQGSEDGATVYAFRSPVYLALLILSISVGR